MPEPLQMAPQATPNPNAVKWTLNRTIAAEGATYRLPSAPGSDASLRPDWAEELLRIDGVAQVFTVNNFISVTKTASADWNRLVPQVERVLEKAFA